jgi:hypothetical protein
MLVDPRWLQSRLNRSRTGQSTEDERPYPEPSGYDAPKASILEEESGTVRNASADAPLLNVDGRSEHRRTHSAAASRDC